MALTNDQLKLLWLNEQTSSNPRYGFMNDTEKASFNAQLNDYYDINQQTFISKYSGNTIDTPVSTDIIDDSERAPFSVKQSSKILFDDVQTDPNTVPLLDDANNRILWMDNNLTVIKEIWYYDAPPSLPTANLLGKIDQYFLSGQYHEGTPDPIGLAELMFRNEYNVISLPSEVLWFNKADANNYLDFTTIDGKNWVPTPKTVITEDQKILIESGSSPSGTLIGTGTTNPLAIVRNNGAGNINNASIVLIFMGDLGTYRTLLTTYINNLLVSTWMNVLGQYGVNSARVVETRIMTEVTNKYITDADIRNIIANDGRIYLILLNQDIVISDRDPKEWVYNGPINGELAVYYHNSLYGVVRYNSNIEYFNIVSALAIGDILTHNWTTDDKLGVMDICGGLRKAVNAAYQIENNTLRVPAIWNQHYNTCSISNDVMITDPTTSVGSLYDTFYWDIGNIYGVKLKVTTQKDLYGIYSYQVVGYMDVNDQSISYDDWYRKYIQPVRDLSQVLIDISPTIESLSLEDVLKNLPTGLTTQIIGNGLVEVTQSWNLVKHYYLYYNDPAKGWQLVEIFDTLPDQTTIDNSLNYRSETFKIGTEIITWNGQTVQSILIGTTSYWTFTNPNPYDPNAFFPNVYYYIDRFSDPFWVNKGSPWTFQYIDPNVQSDSDVLRFNPYELFIGDYFIYCQKRDLFTWEVQDPSIINSAWSIESTGIDGINTWRFGSYIGDSAYKLKIKPTPWTDNQGNTGINGIVTGFQHTDLDGVIREVILPEQTFITDPGNGGGSLILKGSLSVPLLPDIKKLYYDTYTSGKQILQTAGQWGTGNPFLVWGAVNTVISGVNFSEAFETIGDVIGAFSYNNRFTVISQHIAIDMDHPQLHDYVLMEGKEFTTNRIIRIYHEWIPYRIWSPIAVGTPSFTKHTGGFFMTRVYFIP